MDRPNLIEKITRLNPKVERQFLDRFTDNQLADYLRQLQDKVVQSMLAETSTAIGD